MREEIIKLYEYLPEPYRTEATLNYDPTFNDDCGIDKDRHLNTVIANAISSGFDWSSTTQGHSYWSFMVRELILGNIKLIPPFYTKYLKK